MTTTLLLGASGQLGSAIAGLLDEVVAPARTELDLAKLTHETARSLVDGSRATAIINCAAWTDVDAAEGAEDCATAVNGTAVGVLAAVADRAGVPFVTFSTDYVFDGTSERAYREDDRTFPINAYGRSKLVGELAALHYPRSLVIRTSWVQSATHPCFVRRMLELAKERDELTVITDQTGRPTFASDLAAATVQAIAIGCNGVLHVANDGDATWFELASETLHAAHSTTRILPVTTSEFPTVAARPEYSVLDTSKMIEVGVDALPSWRETLTQTVESIISKPF